MISKDISWHELRQANIDRDADVFHEIDTWTPSQWAVAMAGEIGEALNWLKKLNRKRKIDEGEAALYIKEVSHELADAIVYMDLFAQSLHIDLPTAIREKFNIVSEREGSSVRL